jgi:hypothetical protein
MHRTYTVFVQEASGRGTTYITAVYARSVDGAKDLALAECAENWHWDVDDLRILGVAEGSVAIVEWEDLVDSFS